MLEKPSFATFRAYGEDIINAFAIPKQPFLQVLELPQYKDAKHDMIALAVQKANAIRTRMKEQLRAAASFLHLSANSEFFANLLEPATESVGSYAKLSARTIKMGMLFTKKKLLGEVLESEYGTMKETYQELHKASLETAQKNHEILKTAKAKIMKLLEN